MMRRNGLEVSILGAIAAGVSALWLLAEAGGKIASGTPGNMDAAILLAFRSRAHAGQPPSPPWLSEIARDISALGSPEVLCMLVGIVVMFLLFAGWHRSALFLASATLGGAFALMLLKACFDRPRPDVIPYATYVYTSSFPSGHAMLSAVVYLTFGFLVARLTPGRWLKFYVMGIALGLFMLIGISRLYLGTHWPSDVLGGWTAGAAWAFGASLMARFCNLEAGADR